MLVDFYRRVLEFLPAILIAAPVIYWAFHEWKTELAWRRLCALSTIVGAAAALVFLASQISRATFHDWSACRLVSAVTWMRGFELFYPPDRGPVLMQMYGPVSSILYAPAALASRPTPAILIATFLGSISYFAPAAWFLFRARGAAGRAYALAGFVVFALVSSRQFVLYEAATRVTIDAPAVGLATCALAMLIGSTMEKPWRRGLLCGLLIGLSMWTKLTLAPVAGALCVFVFLLAGFRSVLHFAVSTALAMSLVTGVFWLWFGTEMFVQNLLIPARQPWQWPEMDRTAAYLRAMRWIWTYTQSVVWLAALAIAARLLAARRITSVREIVAAHPWILPLLATVFVLPTATLAFVKIGGAWNNAVVTSYFILLSACAALVSACRATFAAWPARVARIVMAIVLVFGSYIGWAKYSELRRGLATWLDLSNNPQELAYRYARQHPGKVYCPFHPLSTFFADGRVCHLDAGLDSVEWAGFSVSDKHLRAWLPPEMNEVLYTGRFTPNVLHRLPEFSEETSVDEMPGWKRRTIQSTRP